jgi:hypothetical protein
MPYVALITRSALICLERSMYHFAIEFAERLDIASNIHLQCDYYCKGVNGASYCLLLTAATTASAAELAADADAANTEQA